MVGDPKQLPPTAFFDRTEADVEDTDVEADLESILDECIGANLPTMNLAWHYQSRHESLIAFSNSGVQRPDWSGMSPRLRCQSWSRLPINLSCGVWTKRWALLRWHANWGSGV